MQITLLKHGSMEAPEPFGITAAGIDVVKNRVGVEKRSNHRAHPSNVHRYVRCIGGRHKAVFQSGAKPFKHFIGPKIVHKTQRGETRRHGERIAGQGTCLIDWTAGADHPHKVRSTAIGADRKAAADHFAECGDVRPDAVKLLSSASGHSKPGHHLIHNQQGAMAVRDILERLKVALLGCDHAHIACHWLDNDRCNRLLDRCWKTSKTA